MRIGIGVEDIADGEAADGERDAVDVALAGELVGGVLDVFLLAAETEGLAEEVTLRAEFRIGRAGLLRFAIGESGEPERAVDAEPLSELGIEIELAAVPQPPSDEGGGGPGLPSWPLPGRLLGRR